MSAVVPNSGTSYDPAISFDRYRRCRRRRPYLPTGVRAVTPAGDFFPHVGRSTRNSAASVDSCVKNWAPPPVHGGVGRGAHTTEDQRRRLNRRGVAVVARGIVANAAATFGGFSPDGNASGEFSGGEASHRDLGKVQTIQVFLVELGLISMGIVDTMMVGQVGEDALAAASLGGSTTWLIIVTMMGLVGALDPLTSQAFGAGDDAGVRQHLRSGIRASVVLSGRVLSPSIE